MRSGWFENCLVVKTATLTKAKSKVRRRASHEREANPVPGSLWQPWRRAKGFVEGGAAALPDQHLEPRNIAGNREGRERYAVLFADNHLPPRTWRGLERACRRLWRARASTRPPQRSHAAARKCARIPPWLQGQSVAQSARLGDSRYNGGSASIGLPMRTTARCQAACRDAQCRDRGLRSRSREERRFYVALPLTEPQRLERPIFFPAGVDGLRSGALPDRIRTCDPKPLYRRRASTIADTFLPTARAACAGVHRFASTSPAHVAGKVAQLALRPFPAPGAAQEPGTVPAGSLAT
jgi:hypothetical protein